jgi:hypothetical protein
VENIRGQFARIRGIKERSKGLQILIGELANALDELLLLGSELGEVEVEVSRRVLGTRDTAERRLDELVEEGLECVDAKSSRLEGDLFYAEGTAG